jgi:hypothetical protein
MAASGMKISVQRDKDIIFHPLVFVVEDTGGNCLAKVSYRPGDTRSERFPPMWVVHMRFIPVDLSSILVPGYFPEIFLC